LESGWQVCGIVYTDHGSDFTSRHLEQVAADLKIQPVISPPGVPRGRGKVERLFRTIEQRLLAELPGYAPPGHAQIAPVLTLASFDARLRRWLLDHYHRDPHREIERILTINALRTISSEVVVAARETLVIGED
jgi:putative transposase